MPKPKKNSKEKAYLANLKEQAKKYERSKMLANERARRYKAKKTEEQLEKKREQDRKSAKERRQYVKDMTDKEKKAARKVWRDRKRELRKRQKEREEMFQENSPPVSDEEAVIVPAREQTRQSEAGKKVARCNRLKIMKELKSIKDENKKLQRKLETYKKRLQREKKKNKPAPGVSPSPRKRLNTIIGTDRVSPGVRRQLFSGLVLEKQLKKQVTSSGPKTKLRQQMTKAVGNEFLKKYRLQKQFKSIVPYTFNRVLKPDNKPNLGYDRKTYNTVKVKEAKAIRDFYEDDTVSKMLPGKKDYIQRGKIKKQRRLLLDSLHNLYGKFVEETKIKNVSRSVFYRCRPWWVQRPKKKDRETCACVKHENIEFIVAALKRAKVIRYTDVHDLLRNIVCSVRNEKCMMGFCSDCKNKSVEYCVGQDEEIDYNKWETITENKIIKGVTKPVKHVEKTVKSEKKSELVKILNANLTLFKKHVFYMIHQAQMLKKLTKFPKHDEICFQIDFSQNYIAKLSTEIQSVHFGASQKQISLHTGAMTMKENNEAKCTTFCTVSDNLDHHAHGVWSHMRPILIDASIKFPDTKSVHFFSDSPSSQYRNKTNVYLMKLLTPQHFDNLSTFSWNYSEGGHGKGVMDGVGGSLKRNSDDKVLFKKDVTCAKDIVDIFVKSKTKTLEIKLETFQHIKSLIPENLDPIEGIMNVKQITWSKKTGTLHFRKLSCFDCPLEDICCHYHLFSITPDGEQQKLKKNYLKPKTKKKLKVSDVYTDEEESPEAIIEANNSFSYDYFKQGKFIVVQFITKKNKSKDYVAVIQSVENLNDREIYVMFLKKCSNDNSMFIPDENDESTISIDEVKGILPTPQMVFKGDRLYYKFSGPVSLL